MEYNDYVGIAMLVTAGGTVITAMATFGAMMLTWRTNKTAINTQMTVTESAANIQKIEIATNSMKDALVAATAKAEHAVGLAQGKLEGRAEEAEASRNF